MSGKIEPGTTRRWRGNAVDRQSGAPQRAQQHADRRLDRPLQGAGRDPSCRAMRGAWPRRHLLRRPRAARLRALQDASNDVIVATYEKLRLLNEAVWFCPRPTVALVQKYAFGAGATLTSWCDIALAENEALFAYPEVHHGFPPSPALMALFLAVGRKKAMELILTGRRIDAVEADRIGLVTRAVPAAALEEELEKILAGLVRGGPDAIKRPRNSSGTPTSPAIARR